MEIDIRVLIGNDSLLQKGVSKQIEQYNTEQFIPVDMPDQNYKVFSLLTSFSLISC